MKNSPADPPSNRLYRNPVLTALMVTSLIFGATASVAGIALWRGSSECQTSDEIEPQGDLLEHPAVDLEMKVEERLLSEPVLSRKVASDCPCVAPSEWPWRI